MLEVISSGVQNEVGIYATRLSDAAAGALDWKPVCTPADNVTSAAVLGEDIYLLSHQGAPHYQVIKVHASDPAVSRGKIVVPPSASVIRGIAAARDGVYLQDLNAGIGGLRRLARDGSVTAVAMPFSGAINGLNTDTLHDGAWFLLQGWVQPSVVCRAEADGRVAQTAIAPKPPIDVSPMFRTR